MIYQLPDRHLPWRFFVIAGSMKKLIVIFAVMTAVPSFADEAELDSALLRVRNSCTGIASEFNKMKTMAGINTAVTGVGTLSGGGAIATGFIKADKDKQIAALKMERLEKIESENRLRASGVNTTQALQLADSYFQSIEGKPEEPLEAQIDRLTRQSKNLGNWRTGLLAGNTAANVAGAIIAGDNKASSDLKGAVDDCKSSLKNLPRIRMQARMDGADAAKLAAAERMISECGAWEYTDVSKIDNRATGAMWSSIAGAGMGAAGTVTSAVANTDKTRAGEGGKEKNLNTASGILAIGATAGSLTATIFNATQIAAIKRASEVADKCEEALQ
jgi:hypothetical protein